jgi:vacuolar-type H+-ATPase subunit F/Vma7
LPDIYLHPRFLDSLARLPKEDQSRVYVTLRKMLGGDPLKGLRRHEVDGFISFSVTMDLRLLVWPSARGDLLVAHVDHHEAAYAWAKRHQVLPDDQGRPATLIELVEQRKPATLEKAMPTRGEILSALLAAGLAENLARYLASLPNESEMLEALESLAPEVQETALAALADALSSPLTPGLPSNIFIVSNDTVLEWALRLPADHWRLFLHPRQRYAIEVPPDRHILLRGGPGTGKTVTLLHRFARLLRQADKDNTPRPALVALNAPTRQVLVDYLSRLGIDDSAETIFESGQLPGRPHNLRTWLRKYSCILIDEAQDLPLPSASALLFLLQEGADVRGLFFTYDVNQAIINPSGDAFRRLESYCDSITLTYCYRATSQIADHAQNVLKHLHSGYKGKDFQHQHEIASTRDFLTANYTTALQGPEVKVRIISTATDIEGAVISEVQALRKHYAEDQAVAVLIVSPDVPTHLRNSITQSLQEASLPAQVLTPEQAKGQEFFAGVVIDMLEHSPAADDVITKSRYRALSKLYVATSRFRDQLICLILSPSSPLNYSHHSKEIPT